jgi:hypothetical protein
MAGDEIVEITLLSGRSAQPSLTFTPGTPSNPVSIGTEGQWAIAGDGVEPVHLYVVFDGRQVHVALAAQGSQALMAGAQVGAEWMPAPVPCELRFGGACLILRHAPRPLPPQEERTMHDGGALWQAAQRAAAAVDPMVRTAPLGPQYPAARPAAGAPAEMGRTVPMMASPLRGLDAQEEATTVRSPLVAPARPAPAPAPATPIEQEVTRIAPQPLRARADQDLAPVMEPPAPAPAPAPQPVAKPGPAAEALAFWRQASPVKKATLVLMPFAVMGSFILFQDPPPPAARQATTTTNRPALAAHDAGAMPPAAPSEPSAEEPQPAPQASTAPPGDQTTRPSGKRTPERAALDAVAAGSFDEASRLYTELATQHPGEASYQEAARILRDKTGGTR